MPHQVVWTPELITKFWDGFAHLDGIRRLSFARLAGAQVLQLASRWIPKDGVCLDYGGGDGDFTEHLLNAGYSVYALEPSSERAAHIRARFAKRDGFKGVLVGNTQTLVDTIFCLEVIEHVHPSFFASFFKDVNNGLRIGGQVFVTCPYEEDLDISAVYCPVCDSTFHRWQHQRSITPRMLRSCFKEAGFETVWQGLSSFQSAEPISEYVRSGGTNWYGNFTDPEGYLLPIIGGADRIVYVARKVENWNDELGPRLATAIAIGSAPSTAPSRNSDDNRFEPLAERAGVTLPWRSPVSSPEQRRESETVALSTALFELTKFASNGGAGYFASCPVAIPDGDGSGFPNRSPLILLENEIALGPPHAEHARIRAHGRGAYSHWGRGIYFSTSDNSDPRSNGRRYRAVWPPTSPSAQFVAAQTIVGNLSAGYTRGEAYAAIERVASILYPSVIFGEESKLFWQEEGLISDFRRVAGTNMRSFERKVTVYNLVRSLGHVAGELAECGVFEGATSFFMAKADQEAGASRELHLFDSFAGLSTPGGYDGDYWAEGALAASEGKVRENLAGMEGVHIHAGWIPTRFSEVAGLQFAFVHIDVDLHDPTRDALEFFYPRLSPGGMIVCDDSGFATCPGATKALRNYFANKPERIISLPTGQDFVIKR
jgi:hypothetical protein